MHFFLLISRYCATWAADDECKKNPGWMLKNCPVACKECDNKCADHEPFCNEWKKNKECTRNPEYMNIYCARSCGKCKVGGAINEFWGYEVTFLVDIKTCSLSKYLRPNLPF